MFALYDRYYSGAKPDTFCDDLEQKSQVLLFFTETECLVGFSTIEIWKTTQDGRDINVLYSGDTILDYAHWGSQVVVSSWLKVAGALKSELGDTPLYWLLITKGHRTYRYLTVFTNEFYPSRKQATPKDMHAFMTDLGRKKFGDKFDPKSGIVRNGKSAVALKKAYEGREDIGKSNADAAFFMTRNPGYNSGDELLCLCELTASNLRPMARKWFLGGGNAAKLEATL